VGQNQQPGSAAQDSSADSSREAPPDLLRAGKELLLFLPRVVQLRYRLARDPEVPREAKAALGFTIFYLLYPIDIIPDFIPILGHLDDLYVIALGVSLVTELAGEEKVRQHWSGSQDVVDVISKVNKFVWRVLPAGIVKKIQARFDAALKDPDRYVGEVERAEEVLLREDQYRWLEDEGEESKT